MKSVLELKQVDSTAIKSKSPTEIKAKLSILGSKSDPILKVLFDVQGPALHVKKDHPGKDPSSIWELWTHDVVEIFLGPEKAPPYFEFQVSPLGQIFQLKIDSPRKVIHTEFRCPGFQASAKILKDTPKGSHWEGEMNIPLRALSPNPDLGPFKGPWVGGLFSILGTPQSFWAAFLPKANPPDFHKPDLFQTLFSLQD